MSHANSKQGLSPGWLLILALLFTPATASLGQCQELPSDISLPESSLGETAPLVASEIPIDRSSTDSQIATRLQKILSASKWFSNISVNVSEGIVVMTGSTSASEHRDWAGSIALKTEDVIAVVNKISIQPKSIWDISPIKSTLRDFAREAVQLLPLIAIGSLLLVATLGACKLTIALAGRLLLRKTESTLLRSVLSRAAALPVFLLGIYLILRISGLTKLAVTVLGGTGLLGLILGIAFRDIAENFIASILLSIQHPFKRGDLIFVSGQLGYVQRVTTRGTVLMTLEGNHVQIPNSTIYKEELTNYSANPNIRVDFVVGIGYDSSIAEAQNVALKVLNEHPTVLDSPEPLVLAEDLGASTVNLRIYAWLNGRKHSHWKVKSALIRLTKLAFEDADISMPDEAREVVFPEPIRVLSNGETLEHGQPKPKRRSETSAEPETEAEGGLISETKNIAEQASMSNEFFAREPDLLK